MVYCIDTTRELTHDHPINRAVARYTQHQSTYMAIYTAFVLLGGGLACDLARVSTGGNVCGDTQTHHHPLPSATTWTCPRAHLPTLTLATLARIAPFTVPRLAPRGPQANIAGPSPASSVRPARGWRGRL